MDTFVQRMIEEEKLRLTLYPNEASGPRAKGHWQGTRWAREHGTIPILQRVAKAWWDRRPISAVWDEMVEACRQGATCEIPVVNYDPAGDPKNEEYQRGFIAGALEVFAQVVLSPDYGKLSMCPESDDNRQRDKKDEMIDRLRQSLNCNQKTKQKFRRAGLVAGRRWAGNEADVEHLQNLEKADLPGNEGWLDATPTRSPAVVFLETIFRRPLETNECLDFWAKHAPDGYPHDSKDSNENLVKGFAIGALQIWRELANFV